jgi:dihydrofolate reductase/thymidylate synthase
MYKLIVARNSLNGIGIRGSLPWPRDTQDLSWFKSCTDGHAIIMGRATWQSLPMYPLPNRVHIILTHSPHLLGDLPKDCHAFASIKACDQFLNEWHPHLERWVIGGEAIYNGYLEKELVSDVYISQRYSSEVCDRFFNWFSHGELHGFQLIKDPSYKQAELIPYQVELVKLANAFTIQHYRKHNHEEHQLLDAMREIIDSGTVRPNRTGIATRALFGKMFEYHMVEKPHPKTGEPMYRLPLITTKKMFLRGVFGELKWFLNGRVDSKELEAKGINIWKGNTSREFLDRMGLSNYAEGETGPIYGFQWRHWGARYEAGRKDYQKEGIDQVARVIETLTADPFSRRHIISGWNVQDLDQMCLPPCFLEGALVLTKGGYKEIQNLLDCDLVFTHLGNWRPIINRQDRPYEGLLYSIDHLGSTENIRATEEHPFLVKTLQIVGFEPLKYALSAETSWVAAKNLNPDKHVLCIPIAQEQRPVSVTITVDGELAMAQPIDYFMVGVYIGKRGSLFDLQFIPPGWSILKQFSACPRSSTCDHIPEWVQRLPNKDLTDLIKGFEFACRSKHRTVANKCVALSLQRIYAKLGILTRVLTNEGSAAIARIPNDMQGRCKVDAHYMYLPILEISSKPIAQRVYNLEVADDNSYTVENIATHNCHVLYQFMVHETEGQKYLSLMMTQRSCDTFLGLPFNLSSLGIFLFLMASTVGMKPHKIIHSIADMHIYESHIEAAREQIRREPYAFPYIQLRAGIQKKPIESYEFSDLEVVDYFCHDPIRADMAA